MKAALVEAVFLGREVGHQNSISSGGVSSSSVTQRKGFFVLFGLVFLVLFHLLISFSELQIWNMKMLS